MHTYDYTHHMPIGTHQKGAKDYSKCDLSSPSQYHDVHMLEWLSTFDANDDREKNLHCYMAVGEHSSPFFWIPGSSKSSEWRRKTAVCGGGALSSKNIVWIRKWQCWPSTFYKGGIGEWSSSYQWLWILKKRSFVSIRSSLSGFVAVYRSSTLRKSVSCQSRTYSISLQGRNSQE